MRIALRPSGGRGDYELAGSYGSLHASDLLDKHFSFQITPSLLIDGKATARRLSGKPRIRPVGGKHAYEIVSSILLLPVPRRELLKTPEHFPELRASEYIVAGIDIDVVSKDSENVTFAPTSVWAKSRGGVLKIDFAERMAVITTLWSAAALQHSELANLLKTHQTSVKSSDHNAIAGSATAIRKYFGVDGDVLPMLLHALGLPDATDPVYTGVSASTTGLDNEDGASTPVESMRERVRRWRLQAGRGPGARAFSTKVKEAYDFRCLFSGERFPKLSGLNSAGVDGAHILPWSTHQLNSVPNGICLCKQCHWGFDNGLLLLDFDSKANAYVLSIAEGLEVIAQEEKFDLLPFLKNSGKIDPVRLPKNKNLWPSAKHIAELNSSTSLA